MTRLIRSMTMIVGCALITAGCADKIPLTQPSALQTMAVYKLGAGDTLRVNVFNEPNLSGDFLIASDGTLSIPLIEPMKVEGLTADEVRIALTSTLSKGFVNNPRVTTQIITFRPYYVMGEVERPGRYPTGDQVTALRAIATAGGFTYRANNKFVYLRRQGQPEIKVPLDSDFQILPGDVIRIGERYF